MKRLLAILALTVLAAFAAGCGSDEEQSASTTPAADEPPRAPEAAAQPEEERPEKAKEKPAPHGARLKVVSSQFGDVVADDKGEAIYLFDKEKEPRSECYGECAAAWPPMITEGEPVAGDGMQQKLLGTTQRDDGKLQVTYRGHPLYYYVGDSPGQILCQNVDEFGGLWLVVQPDGQPVT